MDSASAANSRSAKVGKARDASNAPIQTCVPARPTIRTGAADQILRTAGLRAARKTAHSAFVSELPFRTDSAMRIAHARNMPFHVAHHFRHALWRPFSSFSASLELSQQTIHFLHADPAPVQCGVCAKLQQFGLGAFLRRHRIDDASSADGLSSSAARLRASPLRQLRRQLVHQRTHAAHLAHLHHLLLEILEIKTLPS